MNKLSAATEDNHVKFKIWHKRPLLVQAKQMKCGFEVEILGVMAKGKPGDFLVIGIAGEMYPVDQDIFLETYIIGRPKI